MPFLYKVTLRSNTADNQFQFLKLQLIANDQMHALELATEKAKELSLEVARLEEIEKVNAGFSKEYVLSMNGKNYAI